MRVGLVWHCHDSNDWLGSDLLVARVGWRSLSSDVLAACDCCQAKH